MSAPDLIIEILSPGNSSKEMRVKKQLYEENAVREYWIFDPEYETVHPFTLRVSGEYAALVIYIHEEVLVSSIFRVCRSSCWRLLRQSKSRFAAP